MLKKLAVAAMLTASLAACDQNAGTKQNVGTLLGAVGGGLAGSQIGGGRGTLVAVGVGTLLGALVGGEVGKSLDNADRAAMAQTTHRTLETVPSGQTTSWRNPDTGNYGTVTPQPAYQTSTGQQCREFTQTVTVGGRTQEAYGTACRQPDGTWKIVSG
jgi:surface antigen